MVSGSRARPVLAAAAAGGEMCAEPSDLSLGFLVRGSASQSGSMAGGAPKESSILGPDSWVDQKVDGAPASGGTDCCNTVSHVATAIVVRGEQSRIGPRSEAAAAMSRTARETVCASCSLSTVWSGLTDPPKNLVALERDTSISSCCTARSSSASSGGDNDSTCCVQWSRPLLANVSSRRSAPSRNRSEPSTIAAKLRCAFSAGRGAKAATGNLRFARSRLGPITPTMLLAQPLGRKANRKVCLGQGAPC
ncbi:MAG: hypothetical protein RLZZ450_1278 [Pseudomonadota bacterium]